MARLRYQKWITYLYQKFPVLYLLLFEVFVQIIEIFVGFFFIFLLEDKFLALFLSLSSYTPGFRNVNEGNSIKLELFHQNTETKLPDIHLSEAGAQLLAHRLFEVCIRIPKKKFEQKYVGNKKLLKSIQFQRQLNKRRKNL